MLGAISIYVLFHSTSGNVEGKSHKMVKLVGQNPIAIGELEKRKGNLCSIGLVGK